MPLGVKSILGLIPGEDPDPGLHINTLEKSRINRAYIDGREIIICVGNPFFIISLTVQGMLVADGMSGYKVYLQAHRPHTCSRGQRVPNIKHGTCSWQNV